jgi:hypothetical protein
MDRPISVLEVLIRLPFKLAFFAEWSGGELPAPSSTLKRLDPR